MRSEIVIVVRLCSDCVRRFFGHRSTESNVIRDVTGACIECARKKKRAAA